MSEPALREVLVIGGGLAGLSAAVYLGRSRRNTLVVHSNRSMAKWETDVQNYLGFPDGIEGSELLCLGRAQALRCEVDLVKDEIQSITKTVDGTFRAQSREREYRAKRVLIAMGLTHLPPEIPGVKDCLGKSLFFCKDCDAFRLQGRRIVVIGHNNEAADYALAMLLYSPSVVIVTNGKEPRWDAAHAAWIEEYRIAVRRDRICTMDYDGGYLQGFAFHQGEPIEADAAFTTRGHSYHSDLAEEQAQHSTPPEKLSWTRISTRR